MKYLIFNIYENRTISVGHDTIESAEAWLSERRINPLDVIFIQYQKPEKRKNETV